MWSLLEFFPSNFLINVLDVGAALSERPPYQPLVDAGRARIIGFEPDGAECERLNKTFGPPHRFFPHFVGDGQPATFHETNWALTGSLFAPNTPLLEKFQNLSELVTPVAMHAVDTTRVDDLVEIEDVDFFKMDVQGSELAVFENARRILADTLVIDTEVEFVELYQGQPLFADVDAFLRRQGFQFHTFNGYAARPFKPLANISQGCRQLLWSDAIYVRDWMHLDGLSEIKLQKYAVLAHDLLKSYDLAHLVLTALDKKTGGDVASAYLNRLSGIVGGNTCEVGTSERAALDLIEQGNGLEDEGLPEQALERYESAIRLAPTLARAHLNRGNVLLDRGEAEGALAAYAKALVFSPAYAAAHYNTGNAYLCSDRREAALAAYDKAIELKPDFVDAEVARSNVLKDLGRLDDAVVSYRRLLKITPGSAELHIELGNALQGLARHEEAAASYRRALEIQPDSAETHNNLGIVLQALECFDEAVVSLRRALDLKPDLAPAHNNLGNALQELGQLDQAAACIRRALDLKPDFAAVHSSLLFVHHYLVGQPVSLMREEAVRYGELVARQVRPSAKWHISPDPTRRLRVGFVSGDLRQHPIGNFLEGVFASLLSEASGRLEVFAYASHHCCDEVTERIKAHCQAWHWVAGMDDESLAQRIRDDGIDILIDLSGHTAHNRLPMFAWKPAPVQATWLGYLATTGVSAIDYVIADDWTFPAGEEENFIEKVWRLPGSYLCFTPPSDGVDVGPLPAISKGYVTFGSFNNLSKMNDDVVALWSRVLTAVPNSRIFLKAKLFKERSVRQSVIERFAAHGIGADRLILEGRVPRADYLRPFQRVDIALDPFPYPGITTSVENLWMGVPVLTLAGKHFLSRQGVGLLMNAGLPEWIAETEDDYVSRAVSHASDLQSLSLLRSELRQRVLASPIFDAPRFAQHFEAALRGMWQKWCEQQMGSPH